MIIEETSIKNQMHIETLSFSAVFKNICFNRLRLTDFSSHNHEMLENMTCILFAISESFAVGSVLLFLQFTSTKIT
jgi:hypothetical protein